MYKQDLALNNHQRFVSNQIKNQTNVSYMINSSNKINFVPKTKQ